MKMQLKCKDILEGHNQRVLPSSKFILGAIINSNVFNMQRKNKHLSYQLLKCIYNFFGTPCIYIDKKKSRREIPSKRPLRKY